MSRDGSRLGTISDLVFDTNSGRLAYVVLSTGGTSGAATGKLFAIPTRALKMSAGQDQIVLNVDKDRLLNAPSFESNTWPNMANRESARMVSSRSKAGRAGL